MAQRSPQQQGQTVTDAVAAFRRTYLRVRIKGWVLGFAGLKEHLHASGVRLDSEGVDRALLDHFCGREGIDYDVQSGGEADLRAFFSCAGLDGPDYEAQALAVAKQPWRSLMEPLAKAVANLAKQIPKVGLGGESIVPVYELRAYFGAAVPGCDGGLTHRPSTKANELLDKVNALCIYMLDHRATPIGRKPVTLRQRQVWTDLRLRGGTHGCLSGELKVPGCTGPTLGRDLKALRGHGHAELVEGTKRWRVVGDGP